MSYSVYKHTSPSGKVYIGITCLPVERRWQKGTNYKNNQYFSNAINKYGWDNIKHEVLLTGLTKEEAEQKEVELIKQYKSNIKEHGYNIQSGGMSNGHLSEETKRKLSEANKGKYYGNHRKHTEEEKKRISEKLKGRVSPMKGKHWTEEQRARVGTAVVCLETGQTFYSVHEASRVLGLNHSNILKVVKGVYKQTGGYHFEYAKK